tara:strand:- start:506 stop:1282 length:777 start_codon:yes stop_codon:yes gene_type:complete
MKNLEVSNAPTLVLYLLPTTKACPAAGTCRKICLNTAGNPVYLDNKLKCRKRRNDAFMQDFNLFLRNLVLETIRFYSKNRDYEKLGLRLNGTSDYAWENVPITITSNDSKYLLKQFGVYIEPIRYTSILEAILKGLDTKLNQSISTKLIAYDYTKRIDRDWNKCSKLKYHLTLSHGSKFDTLSKALELKLNYAAAFDLKKSEALPEYIEINGLKIYIFDADKTDFRPLDNNDKTYIAGLRIKRTPNQTKEQRLEFCLA